MNTAELTKMIDAQIELGSKVNWYYAYDSEDTVLSVVTVNGNYYFNSDIQEEMDLFFEASASHSAARGW